MDNAARPRFYIEYGWAEGSWMGKRLITALKDEGFVYEPLVERADIIIAHSAGVSIVPANNARLIVAIGPAYWPGRSILTCLLQKIRDDQRSHALGWWLTKTAHNCRYIISHLARAKKMWRVMHTANPLNSLPTTAIIIRNADDRFCTPQIGALLHRDVLELPGQHDDCWEHPAPYIALIKNHFKKR